MLVRILKLKRKSEIKSLSKTSVFDQNCRKTYDRLKNIDHINKKAAILIRDNEKFTAENKIFRKKVEDLRKAIFKKKAWKSLEFL
jgi:hypothetical protein